MVGRKGRHPLPDRSLPASDDELSRRLNDLDRRLDQARPAPREAADAPSAAQGMAMGLRLAADFVAGVVVGAALGWGFDRLFDTSPWGLIVLLFLGFGAGVLSMLRTAGMVAKPPGIDSISDRGEN